MQFFLEFACRLNNNGNYYISSSFRGEPADERHLCQFYHSEAELIGNLEDVISLVEEYLKYLVTSYLKNDLNDIEKITPNHDHILQMLASSNIKLPRCEFSEAIILLQDNPGCLKNKDGIKVITSKGEKELIKHFNGVVWLLYPDHLSVPFYQAYKKDNKNLANCADLLFGIGKIGGY